MNVEEGLHALRGEFCDFRVSVEEKLDRVFGQQEEMLRVLQSMQPKPPPEN